MSSLGGDGYESHSSARYSPGDGIRDFLCLLVYLNLRLLISFTPRFIVRTKDDIQFFDKKTKTAICIVKGKPAATVTYTDINPDLTGYLNYIIEDNIIFTYIVYPASRKRFTEKYFTELL